MDRRDLLRCALAAPLITLPMACGRSGDASVLSAGVDRSRPSADTPVEQTVAGIAELGHALARMKAAPDTNVVVSPLSIAYAFAMVRGGAGGETAAQLDEVFGFPAEGPHAAFNALTYDLVSTDEPAPVATGERDAQDPPQPPIVAIANQLFPDVETEVREPYLKLLGVNYGADLRTVDFGSPDAAAEAINDWVKEQTAERIDKLFDTIDPHTILVLANAIYLKADWATPFDEVPAVAFITTSGEIDARMLRQAETELPYAITDRWQAVDIPYAGGELFMRVIVPADDSAPTDLLSPGTMSEVAGQLAPGIVDLTIPEWDFATNLELVPALSELGVRAAFNKFDADLEGMFASHDGGNPYIEQAIHRANMTVDKWGTEAAAVTGAGVVTTSAPPTPEVTIKADRPFAFAIMHRQSQAPLFVGQVANPTA